jgi:hypothetical protein
MANTQEVSSCPITGHCSLCLGTSRLLVDEDEGHAGELCNASSADSNRMIAGFEDGTVRAWDARTEKMIRMKERLESRVRYLSSAIDDSNTVPDQARDFKSPECGKIYGTGINIGS